MKKGKLTGTILLISALFIALLSCDNSAREGTGRVVLPDTELFKQAGETFIQKAKQTASEEPATVSGNAEVQQTGPGRTYVSLACYWWPDPKSDNGLPYIRRDGEVNPETRSAESDLPAMIRMAGRVQVLSAAYHITGDERFAAAATDQLRAWFTDPETAMLPHLEHAQMVRGMNTGRSYGVIDTWWLVRVVESTEYLRNSASWNEELESGLKAWFTHYLNWLSNSEFGRREQRSRNNHGTWYDVQVVTFALFTGQSERAVYQLEMSSKNRISRQIGRNGRQRHELRRPRPEHYSIYNLNGLMKLAEFGSKAGVDLKNHSGLRGNNLRDAARFVIELMEGKRSTDHVDALDRTDTAALYIELLLKASSLYNDDALRSEAIRILNEELAEDPGLFRIIAVSAQQYEKPAQNAP
jgi:hypothetical protein